MDKEYLRFRDVIGKNGLAEKLAPYFLKELAATQKLFLGFSKRQCALEADLTMGSAGGWEGEICLKEMIDRRTKWLSDKADLFSNK